MTKLIRFRLSLIFLLLVGLPICSATAASQRSYTIKKGDTLWGISERFIKDPYYWPNLWANNPRITNPHLIYPGQTVRLYNGRIELVPEYTATEQAPAPEVEAPAPKPVEEAPAPVKQVDIIKASGSGDGFILTDEKPLGELVDSVDSRVLLTKSDLVFLRMANVDQVEIGDTYSLYGRGQQINHPLTRQPFGTMMHELGFVQITEINGNTVVAKIGEVYREIERGAEVFEYVEPQRDIELKKSNGELAGHIISGQQEKLTQAQNDVVYIDLGTSNGLQVGNILFISRPRVSTELATSKDQQPLELPDNLLGAAVVVETRNQSAAALIFKSVAEMHVGDQVMAAAE